jgi:hypothetical protein
MIEPTAPPSAPGPSAEESARRFYRRILQVLNAKGVPFLVAGTHAFADHTGIRRRTKDFDVFTREEDAEELLAALAADGCSIERTSPHWLSKARCGDDFVDVIHNSGNAVARVDDRWFANAVEARVLGVPVLLCPVEEMIWSKSFIMERERYDGADVAHLLHDCGDDLDWARLVERFGDHWRVLLSHLVLFGFIYPQRRAAGPEWVLDELLARLEGERETAFTAGKLCRGTLLSRTQFLVDVEERGYRDARLPPRGNMTPQDVERWQRLAEEEEGAPAGGDDPSSPGKGASGGGGG